jgi:hypothetical protein
LSKKDTWIDFVKNLQKKVIKSLLSALKGIIFLVEKQKVLKPKNASGESKVKVRLDRVALHFFNKSRINVGFVVFGSL